MHKKVYISTPFCHCSLRKLEAEKLRNYFSINNYTLVDNIEDADFHICVTCAVTKANLNNHIEYFKTIANSSGELIVAGCLPGTNPKELKQVFSGKVIVTKDIADIDKFFPDFRIKFTEVPEVYFYDIGAFHMFTDDTVNQSYFNLLCKYGFSKTFFSKINRKRQANDFYRNNKNLNVSEPCFVKISSGCANNCTYCNIRDAIGKIKSKSIENLCVEYRSLLEEGNRNFHFIAEDLCSYGLDIKSSLGDLLTALSEVDYNYDVKWTLNGVNPNWLSHNYKEFASLFKSKIWEIMIAVESGSDRLIELMNRKYVISELEETLINLRKINPGFRINSLFILGFPSETDEDFQSTINLIKNVKFDSVTLTNYSEFENRASAKIFPKVDAETIYERRKRAEDVLKKLKIPLY
ncbi:MAG: radical SAM protein [Bacteroidales bacterium]|jgi:tRNA A37 methylthiotransferase MiaB|nr:radical SAM protein [Bacteroidales bacterium]